MKTATAEENRRLGSMISSCKCPSEDPELLPKSNFCGCGKIPTAAVSRSGIHDRTEVLHLVVVRVQHGVARVSLSKPRGIISTCNRPVQGIHQSCNARHIVWVYGLCQVVDMGTMMMISWD